MLDTVIILAGGRSSRMGYDKQEVRIDGKLIVEYQIEQLEDLISDIVIVTKKPELYDNTKYTVVSDIYPDRGPLSGLHVGLLNAKSDAAILLACDMPNISREYIKYLKSIYRGEGIASTWKGYIEPVYAVYPKDLVSEIEQILIEDENTRPMRLIKGHDFQIISEEKITELTDKDIFANFNTPEELKALTS